MHHEVVIVGYRLNAKEPAAKALERILRLAPELARKLARSFPATVLSSATEDEAEQLAEQLRQAGAVVEVRANERAPAALPTASALPRVEAGRAATAPSFELAGAPPRAAPRHEPQSPVPRPENSNSDSDLASYRLGDFGLEQLPGAGRASSTKLPAIGDPDLSGAHAPPSPPRAEDGSVGRAFEGEEQGLGRSFELDLELSSSGHALELDDGPLDAHAPLQLDTALPKANADLHALGERFDGIAAPSSGADKAPETDPRAFRPVQRAPRPRPSVRPAGRQAALDGALSSALRSWLPSLLLLTLLVFGTALAVGYALDPSDALGALERRGASARDEAVREREDAALHPLLAATPAVARAPLAAILRARMAGVHDVPVSFSAPRGSTAHCTLVERDGEDAESRLAEVRATGRTVQPPAGVAAQLDVHARALAASLGRKVAFTPVCLAL